MGGEFISITTTTHLQDIKSECLDNKAFTETFNGKFGCSINVVENDA